MMTDIFSSFDPYSSFCFASISQLSFWILSFLSITLLIPSLWVTPARMTTLLFHPKSMMNSQSARTFNINLKSNNWMLVTLFFMIISLNLMGLLPYSFSMSSHLFMTLTLGLPLWLSLILSAMFHAPKSLVAHLLPNGAPEWLNPFLVITETLSILVRFITLSFRLAANMSAGHILLGLMGITASANFFTSSPQFITIITIQMGYLMFELGICFIQAYIFCLLLSLYSDDHPSN